VPARVVGFQPGDDLPFHSHEMSLHEVHSSGRYLVSPQVKYSRRMFPPLMFPSGGSLPTSSGSGSPPVSTSPGSRSPQKHRLVEETGLSRSTVQKALRALREEGTVYSVARAGNVRRPEALTC